MTDSPKKKQAPKKRQSPKKKSSKSQKKQPFIKRIKHRIGGFLSRRPHRSFHLTRRRDYARSLKLPGYWSFTATILGVIRKNKKSLLIIGLLYAALSVFFLGIGSQQDFAELRESLNEVAQNFNWGDLATASLLAVSTVSGNISPEMTEAQQIYTTILVLLLWLSVVWLLRQRLANRQVKVRDALYNAGAPVVPTALLSLVLVIQLIPIALALFGYYAAQASGLLEGGVEAMLFWSAAFGLALLSLYWITGTFLALVIVTLPGMYPFRALKIAGDMIVGRRLRILLRIMWLFLLLGIAWMVIMTIVILLDAGVKQLLPVIAWMPIIPVVMLLLSSMSLIVIAVYIYLLYRRIVDDDAKPA